MSKFPSARQLDWEPDMGQAKRRRVILEGCKGNALKAAKILSKTATYGSGDAKRKAKADATHFFRIHDREK
jgi:hypothetical protein